MNRLSCMRFWAFVALLSSGLSLADEFLYPVAATNVHEKSYVYLIYQKSLDHLELWIWDPATKVVTKGLLSAFTPAGLRLLPGGQGFSFIDNGRIKIKQFNKRSPKSLELNEPLYEITLIEWLDEHSFFLSAKERERFSIYQVDMQGNTEKIVTSDQADCLYPCKVADTLFYLERDDISAVVCRYQTDKHKHQHSRLMSVPYPYVESKMEPSFNDREHFDERVAQLLQGDGERKKPLVAEGRKQKLIDFGTMPVAFLHMESATEGFVVEYPEGVEQHDTTLPLTYHRISLSEQGWGMEALFNFEVPLHLLWPSSTTRLYESMLPLLPRHTKDGIYFVDCVRSPEKQSLDIFLYTLDGKIEQKTRGHGLHDLFFGVLPYDAILMYGGSIDTLAPTENDGLGGNSEVALKSASRSGPYCWIGDEGEMCLEMPTLPH